MIDCLHVSYRRSSLVIVIPRDWLQCSIEGIYFSKFCFLEVDVDVDPSNSREANGLNSVCFWMQPWFASKFQPFT